LDFFEGHPECKVFIFYLYINLLRKINFYDPANPVCLSFSRLFGTVFHVLSSPGRNA
jgi:hypothetical protein